MTGFLDGGRYNLGDATPPLVAGAPEGTPQNTALIQEAWELFPKIPGNDNFTAPWRDVPDPRPGYSDSITVRLVYSQGDGPNQGPWKELGVERSFSGDDKVESIGSLWWYGSEAAIKLNPDQAPGRQPLLISSGERQEEAEMFRTLTANLLAAEKAARTPTTLS